MAKLSIDESRAYPLLSQWWALIIRGVLTILFGAAAVLWPALTLVALVALFAGFALADGITSLIAAVRNRSWGWPLIGGVLSIAVGFLTLMWPGPASFALVLLIGTWALVRGVFDIALAVALRKEINYEWVLGLSGILSVLFGLFVVLFPAAGAMAIIGIIAGFAIALGVLLIISGIRQQRIWQHLRAHEPLPQH